MKYLQRKQRYANCLFECIIDYYWSLPNLKDADQKIFSQIVLNVNGIDGRGMLRSDYFDFKSDISVENNFSKITIEGQQRTSKISGISFITC